MKKAVYAGSFDPITLGHFDIIKQALLVFDEVTIAIGTNPKKTRLFDPTSAASIIKHAVFETLGNTDRVKVILFNGPLVTLAKDYDAVVRGFRQVSDFNDEFTQHGINTTLTDKPWVYFICKTEFLHVSSSTVKEMVELGLDVTRFVDPVTAKQLYIATSRNRILSATGRNLWTGNKNEL